MERKLRSELESATPAIRKDNLSLPPGFLTAKHSTIHGNDPKLKIPVWRGGIPCQ